MRLIALLVLGLAATVAQAQPYLFVGLGWADVQTNLAAEGNSQTYLYGAGYRATKHLGAEITRLDLRQVAGRRQNGNVSTVERWSAEGWAVSSVATFAVSESLSVLARLGAAKLEGETESRSNDITTASPGQTVTTTSDLHWLLTFGAGLQLELSPNLKARLILEQINGKAELDRIRLFAWSVVYQF